MKAKTTKEVFTLFEDHKTTIELFTLLRFVHKEKLCRGRIVLQRRQFIYWQTKKKAVKWEREKWREG